MTDQGRQAQESTANTTIVACLGSSSTAGKGQAFNWISELERRECNKRFRFRNFGVGGDFAYNALQRLPSVLACRPERVVVWVGGNEVLAVVSKKVRLFFRISKHLPNEPSPEWFRENLQTIVHRLKAHTQATIALCSLPPIGEAPGSANPFQSEINRRITGAYSAMYRRRPDLYRPAAVAPGGPGASCRRSGRDGGGRNPAAGARRGGGGRDRI